MLCCVLSHVWVMCLVACVCHVVWCVGCEVSVMLCGVYVIQNIMECKHLIKKTPTSHAHYTSNEERHRARVWRCGEKGRQGGWVKKGWS